MKLIESNKDEDHNTSSKNAKRDIKAVKRIKHSSDKDEFNPNKDVKYKYSRQGTQWQIRKWRQELK